MLSLYHPLHILLGVGLLIVTVVIHMTSLMELREQLHRLPMPKSWRYHLMQESVVATVVVTLLSFIHILEVVVWGLAYFTVGAISRLDDAVYYSMTTYTTVGAEGVEIGASFRGLAGFESLIGPVMVAWSTAFLVEALAQIRAEFQTQERGRPRAR